jgi:predicted transcriptional regulator of viral defense system
VVAAQTAPIPWAQRLGYLLELVEAGKLTQALKSHVRAHARQARLLMPTKTDQGSQRDEDWKLDINADMEAKQ